MIRYLVISLFLMTLSTSSSVTFPDPTPSSGQQSQYVGPGSAGDQ